MTCALGIHYVGFVIICFGAANSVCSFVFGRLARYTGRPALVCLGKLTETVAPSRCRQCLAVSPGPACRSLESVRCPAVLANLSCIITFLLWKPDPEQLYLFFLLPALWGLADAVWQTQANGKSGNRLRPICDDKKKKKYWKKKHTNKLPTTQQQKEHNKQNRKSQTECNLDNKY